MYVPVSGPLEAITYTCMLYLKEVFIRLISGPVRAWVFIDSKYSNCVTFLLQMKKQYQH